MEEAFNVVRQKRMETSYFYFIVATRVTDERKKKKKQQEQESVRPRWPYDMRPSVRAEKYGCPQCVPKSTSVTLAVDEKTLPMATITGRTDRQTDGQTFETQYAAPS